MQQSRALSYSLTHALSQQLTCPVSSAQMSLTEENEKRCQMQRLLSYHHYHDVKLPINQAPNRLKLIDRLNEVRHSLQTICSTSCDPLGSFICLHQSEIIQNKPGVQQPFSNCMPQNNEHVTSVCLNQQPCNEFNSKQR